jgi:hypothetical protein
MLSSPALRVRRLGFYMGLAALLALAASASADPKPLGKKDQAKVDKAIDKAVAFLKRKQTKEGNWPTHWKNRFLVGECALPAYALLEAGVPAADPIIQKAAEFIRPKVPNTDDTYELSLAVLFFDRLGDPKDKPLIQTCALRLIAGQYRTGGWSYICPRFKEGQEADLLKALQELSKLMKDGKSKKESLKELVLPERVVVWPWEPPLPTADSRIDYQKIRRQLKLHRLPRKLQGLKCLTVFQDLEKNNWREQPGPLNSKVSTPLVGATDNSNTQFALLALWIAQQYDIPTQPTFRLLVKRFEMEQNLNGSWDYAHKNDPKERLVPSKGRPSMTCVGLLGLAIGQGMASPTPAAPALKEDSRILAGLLDLYLTIGRPGDEWEKPVRIKQAGYIHDVYFLWSVERVAMLFNLPTLGDKEWYRWGAELLVTNQLETGEFDARDWSENEEFRTSIRGFYGPILKTAFALLFLKHSHPMRNLTSRLPFTANQLNQGIDRLRPRDSHMEGSAASPSYNTKRER